MDYRFMLNPDNRRKRFVSDAGRGQIEAVRKVISSGAVNINIRDGDNETALIKSSGNGHTTVVNALVEAGADLDLTSGAETALTKAIRNRHTDIAHILLRAGANVNACAYIGDALLHFRQIKKRNLTASTALITAAEIGDSNMVEILLDAGADPNIAKQGMLGASPEPGDDALGRWGNGDNPEYEKHCPDDRPGESALIASAKTGNMDIIRMLIDAGADVNATFTWKGWDVWRTKNSVKGNALLMAANFGFFDIVVTLIEAGAKVSDELNILLEHSDTDVRMDIVRELVKADTSLDNSVIYAVKRERPDIVELLINAGANIDMSLLATYRDPLWFERSLKDSPRSIQDIFREYVPYHLNALSWAIRKGNTHIVKMLVEAGADVNAKLNTGVWRETRYEEAREEKLDVSEITLYHTPFLISATINPGDLQITKLLIEAGADVNAREGKYSALMINRANGNEDMVKLLIEAGAT